MKQNEFDRTIKEIKSEISRLKEYYGKNTNVFNTLQTTVNVSCVPTSWMTTIIYRVTFPPNRVPLVSAALDVNTPWIVEDSTGWAYLRKKLDLDNHYFDFYLVFYTDDSSVYGQTFNVPLVITSTSSVEIERIQ